MKVLKLELPIKDSVNPRLSDLPTLSTYSSLSSAAGTRLPRWPKYRWLAPATASIVQSPWTKNADIDIVTARLQMFASALGGRSRFVSQQFVSVSRAGLGGSADKVTEDPAARHSHLSIGDTGG